MNLRSKWVAKIQMGGAFFEALIVLVAGGSAVVYLIDTNFILRVSLWFAVALYLAARAMYCEYGHPFRRFRRTATELAKKSW